ncbi:MAG: helix-hairpin-helix domain-containing protein [Alphaproteobacteria bacterium]|nr:helix-hairpin-helix domain-containing protein [Alphaproteobacteria bacterium]
MMWTHFCKRWFDLCCWWLPTTKGEEKNGAEAKQSSTEAENGSLELTRPDGEADVGPDEDRGDDLTVIKGIGPSIQIKLRSFGITSLAALAAADPEALAARLKASQPISTTRVKGWIAAAKDRTADNT